jgi:hypothetical protein
MHHHEIVAVRIELGSQDFDVENAAFPQSPQSLAHEYVLDDTLSQR